jgi:hypothetical protein
MKTLSFLGCPPLKFVVTALANSIPMLICLLVLVGSTPSIGNAQNAPICDTSYGGGGPTTGDGMIAARSAVSVRFPNFIGGS